MYIIFNKRTVLCEEVVCYDITTPMIINNDYLNFISIHSKYEFGTICIEKRRITRRRIRIIWYYYAKVDDKTI